MCVGGGTPWRRPGGSRAGPSRHLRDLTLSIRQASLGRDEANSIRIRAWEAAVEGTLEDGLLSLDEENALAKYTDYLSLTQQDLDQNGVQTSLVQAAVIRDVTQGIIPQRQRVRGSYGVLRVDGKQQQAHRLAYIQTRGEIPEGKQVNHLCNRPFCIQPAHLYAGTKQDNMGTTRGYSATPNGCTTRGCSRCRQVRSRMNFAGA